MRGSARNTPDPSPFWGSRNDLLQHRHQRFRRSDIRRMARVHFEITPGGIVLQMLCKLRERIAAGLLASTVDVAAWQGRLAVLQPEFAFKAFDRHVGAARRLPVEIGLRHVRRRRIWWNAPAV